MPETIRDYKILNSLLSGGVLLCGQFLCGHAYAQPINRPGTELPNIQPWLYEDNRLKPTPTLDNNIDPNSMESPSRAPVPPKSLNIEGEASPITNIPNFGEAQPDRLENLDIPDPNNPSLTPPFRDIETSPSGNLYLSHSEIVTEETNDQTRYWLVGKLSNLTDSWVDEVTVHFKVYDQLWVVQSGHFSVHTECVIFDLQCLEFRFPLKETGKLVITFVEWKYADGTQGVSEGGIY